MKDEKKVAEKEAGNLLKMLEKSGSHVSHDEVVQHFRRAEHTARRKGSFRGTAIGSVVAIVGVTVAVATFVETRDEKAAERVEERVRAEMKAAEESKRLSATANDLASLESEVASFKHEASQAHSRIERSLDTLTRDVTKNRDAMMSAIRSRR